MFLNRTATPFIAATVAALFATAAPALADDHGRSRDRDHDGMPDRWEHRHHVARPGADPDHDGLSNLAEYRSHSDPHRADSDRDGVRDGREDADHDGLTNAEEQRLGTNPANADSDHDGRRDDREHPGTVASFEGGVITLALADGGTLTARVTPQTAIECEHAALAPAPTARAASHGSDDSSSSSGPGPSGGSGSGRRDGSGGDDYVASNTTPAAAPVPGAMTPATPTPITPAGDDHPGYDDQPGYDDHGDDGLVHSCDGVDLVGAIVREADVAPGPDGLVLEELEIVVAS